MSFASLKFVMFFPALVLCYYALPVRWRRAFLLCGSVAFYMLSNPAYAVMLLWVVVASYFAVRHLGSAERSRGTLWLWLLAVLGPMLFFKLKEPIINLWFPEWAQWRLPGLNWAIPLGLSCYTLQALGYVIDVYKRRIEPDHSWLNHALFVFFLPTITSGPIQRAPLMMPQFRAGVATFDYPLAVQGAKRMVWGMFLKIVVADRLGIYINSVLQHSAQYNSLTVLIALTLLALQIYTDFAGYSFIAIGAGNLLGYRLAENFHRPLFAVGLKDLWTRWHISLSSWLRDYVYIPLGGSRCSKLRSTFNTIIAFLVSGMWHGILPGYLCWGLCHGVVVSLERFLPLQRLKAHPLTHALGSLVTVMLMGVILGFFRDNFGEALEIYGTLFGGAKSLQWIIVDPVHTTAMLWMIGLTLVVVLARDVYDEWCVARLTRWTRGRRVLRWTFYASLVWMILLFGVLDSSQFIYMRF